MNSSNIIVRPVMTEKATTLAGKNVYAFEVHEDANKFQITQAIEGLYKVEIASVRVLKRKGKVRRYGRRMQTKQMPDVKVAYVTVKTGKIDIFPTA